MLKRLLVLIAVCLLTTLEAEAQVTATASYRVTFISTWSADTHPQDFPSNPHFSGLIGATHNDAISFWDVGELATPGIENMAETGSKSPLSNEVDDAIAAGHAEFSLSGGGIGVSPGSVELEFGVSELFSLVTLVSMVAPSPDWFVGVSGLSLLDAGVWIQQVEVPLVVYDAGTDDGASYVSPNADSDPPQAISELTSVPFDSEQQVGVFVFELQQVVGAEAEDLPESSALVDVYPNPATDLISVAVSRGSGDLIVEVFDLLGRRVIERRSAGYSDRIVELNLAGWSRGLYVVRVTDGMKAEMRPVMVR